MPITDLPQTKLCIAKELNLNASSHSIIQKINEIIGRINFLDEHVNFLYERSRTQYNTLVSQAQGLQNVYDELQELKKRFVDINAKKINRKSIGIVLDKIEHKPNN